MSNDSDMTEAEFRGLAKQMYERIDRAFEDIDPDVAECEIAQGALTIILPDGAKWILSQQPPVCQLWLAVASLGRAYHFNYRPESAAWHDDKDSNLELLSHLSDLLRNNAKLNLTF